MVERPGLTLIESIYHYLEQPPKTRILINTANGSFPFELRQFSETTNPYLVADIYQPTNPRKIIKSIIINPEIDKIFLFDTQ